MAGTYEIQAHSEEYPQKASENKLSFYVKFIASDETESEIQYYEVDTSDAEEAKTILQKTADDYDTMILSSPTEGQIEGL